MKRRTFIKCTTLLPIMLSACSTQNNDGQTDSNETGVIPTSSDGNIDVESGSAEGRSVSLPVYIARYEDWIDTPIQESTITYDTHARILNHNQAIGTDGLESQYTWSDETTQVYCFDGWRDVISYDIDDGLAVSSQAVVYEDSPNHKYFSTWRDTPAELREYSYKNDRLVIESVYSIGSDSNSVESEPYFVRECDDQGRPLRITRNGELTEEWSYQIDGASTPSMEYTTYELGPYGKTEIAGTELKADENGKLTVSYDVELDAYGNIISIYYNGNLIRSIEWQVFDSASSVGIASSFFTLFSALSM